MKEVAQVINADDVIFQDIEDLKAACYDAKEEGSQVENFEIGVFQGRYVTDVPEGYFEHLSSLRNAGKPKTNGVTNIAAGGDEGNVVTTSGTVNGPPKDAEADAKADALRAANGIKTPEHRDDIR